MKANYPILILMVGLGGVVLSGCATSGRRTVASQSAPAASQGEDGTNDDLVADDLPNSSSLPAPAGNPAALAHFAAGVSYEWNDQDELAVKQFDDSALADPSNEHLVIKVAQRFLKNKQFDKAVDVLAKSARRPDASGLLLSWLARAQLQAGKINQALAASRLSIQRQPDAFDGYESQIEILFHNNQLGEAARTLNRAAKSIRPDPQSLVALGGLYAMYLKTQPKDAGVRTNAVALLDRVAQMNFASPRLRQTLADTYTQIDQPKKAAAIYVKLLADTAQSSVVRDAMHEKLASLYFQLADKTNATRQLEAIVRDNPTRYPRAWFFLGELAFADENLSEASDDYENAIHWDPNFEEAWYKLALVQIELHRSEDAFRTLDTARSRFSKTFLCEFYTGVACLHVKKYTEAIHHFDAAEMIARSTDPSQLDFRFYFQLGEACERNQQFKQADEYLQKCINLSPDFGEAINYLGYMLADRGEQLPRARTLIEKAVRLEPKNGAFLDSLGWVLFKQKQPQQALTWLLKAAEYTPEADATMLDHLGEVYMALHQAEKAIDAWKKSFAIEANPDVKKKLDLYSGGA
jgi:tetratricopeptide (TPR) repeat protein